MKKRKVKHKHLLEIKIMTSTIMNSMEALECKVKLISERIEHIARYLKENMI